MTKTLILMRHAKSDWGAPSLPDKLRPLNARGHRSATALGDWLRAKGHVPEAVMCSSAIRTRETLAGLALVETPTCFSDDLYHAEADVMLQVLHRATADKVLMIGHNPGICDFAQMLMDDEPDHIRFHDFPTCATLVARFDIADWAALQWRSGQPVDFTVPRELID